MYEEYLGRFDEDTRPIAEEVFKAWDGQVTRKFQEIHDGYKGYKELTDNYEPEVLSAGVQLLEQLRDNPRTVYDNIANHFKWDDTSNANENGGEPITEQPTQAEVDKFEALQRQIGELNQLIQQQQEQSQRQNELVQFNNYLDVLQQQYGDYDRDWVLGKIASGMDPEQAVQGYSEWYQNVTGRPLNGEVENQYAAPENILGSGGGAANEAFDPTKMNRSQTQDFVANVLANIEQE